ncbi:MAG: hypothetical protein Q4D10_03610 [Bacteroidales bacterium]|nr:hypothetical protein [Bacteroidales bacterium]
MARDPMNDLHSKILRKFHTLCSACGMTPEEKAAVVASFGVDSSADINTHDLIDVCNKLAGQLGQNRDTSKDRLRKQVMAAIGGYLKKIGHESNADIIKGIACRSTGYDDFNKIPVERLRNCYYAFVNKQKDIAGAEAVALAVLMSQGQRSSC